MKITRFFSFLLGCTLSFSTLAANLHDALQQIRSKPNNALLAEATRYRAPLAIRSDELLVPASTLKILTAFLAIERWGLDHRFSTDFYLSGDTLWIKGKGDPFLTSEELLLIKQALKQHTNLSNITKIGVDHSLFPELRLEGRGDSDNPYDAGNAALALNFNTLYVQRQGDQFISGEPQTPLTPLAIKLAQQAPSVSSQKPTRISLPGGRDMAAHYFGEVFSQIVFAQDLPVQIGTVPSSAKSLYQHENSKSLEQVLAAMLLYSNNYIANQLFLLLGQNETNRVTIEAAQTYARTQVRKHFNWPGFKIYDGAGLSRSNRISSQQMLDLLNKFKPWKDLLPVHKGRVLAKTGTLTGVQTYAGFYLDKDRQWRAFALLLNQPSSHRFRFTLAELLSQ